MSILPMGRLVRSLISAPCWSHFPFVLTATAAALRTVGCLAKAGVGVIVWMPSWAMSPPRLAGDNAGPAEQIGTLGNWLHVARIATTAIAADVIYHKSFGDYANGKVVGDTMGHLHFTFGGIAAGLRQVSSVAIRTKRTLPWPTFRIAADVHVAPEAFLEGDRFAHAGSVAQGRRV